MLEAITPGNDVYSFRNNYPKKGYLSLTRNTKNLIFPNIKQTKDQTTATEEILKSSSYYKNNININPNLKPQDNIHIIKNKFIFNGINKSQKIQYKGSDNVNLIKNNISKYKNLIDELMNYLTKILILTPGIQQNKGSSKFNIILFEKYLSVFKNFSFNKEKYYIHILYNLYKLCEGNDDDYPKNFDPKDSVIFFLKYTKIGNKELNSKRILNVLKQFIAETNYLSLSEKNDLLEGIELNSDEDNDEINSINNKIQDKNNNYEEEESNIIIDKNININKENNKINNKILKENEIKNNLDKNYLLTKKNNIDINETKDNDLSLKFDEDFSSSKLTTSLFSSYLSLRKEEKYICVFFSFVSFLLFSCISSYTKFINESLNSLSKFLNVSAASFIFLFNKSFKDISKPCKLSIIN